MLVSVVRGKKHRSTGDDHNLATNKMAEKKFRDLIKDFNIKNRDEFILIF